MALSIRSPVVEERARRLAAHAGQSITAVVGQALTEYEARGAADARAVNFVELERLFKVWDTTPVSDPRSSAELMDELYDEHGLPK